MDFLTFRYTDESHSGWKQKTIGRHYISHRRKVNEPSHVTLARSLPLRIQFTTSEYILGLVSATSSSLTWIRYHPTNTNGKMSLEVYLEQILKPHVGEWLESGDDFVLFEDNDYGHGTSAHNQYCEDLEGGSGSGIPVQRAAGSVNQPSRKCLASSRPRAVNQNARICVIPQMSFSPLPRKPVVRTFRKIR